MDTQITIRVSSAVSKRILKKAKSMGLRKSDVVRLALMRFLEMHGSRNKLPAYFRVADLVGSIRTGRHDLGQRHREYLIGKLKMRP